MKTLGILLFTALLFLTGCQTAPPDVASDFDPITGQRTDIMENILESPQSPPREVLWLNASRLGNDYWRKKNAYYLEVNYMARTETGFLDIPFGSSLKIVADGQEMHFTGNGSVNKRTTSRKGMVSETALYQVTRPQLEQIANAKEVKVEIKGNNGLVQREFAPENFKRFQQFLGRARG